MPVAVRSKTEFSGLSIARVAGSNPSEGMYTLSLGLLRDV
jgi:hypothetical protein